MNSHVGRTLPAPVLIHLCMHAFGHCGSHQPHSIILSPMHMHVCTCTLDVADFPCTNGIILSSFPSPQCGARMRSDATTLCQPCSRHLRGHFQEEKSRQPAIQQECIMQSSKKLQRETSNTFAIFLICCPLSDNLSMALIHSRCQTQISDWNRQVPYPKRDSYQCCNAV